MPYIVSSHHIRIEQRSAGVAARAVAFVIDWAFIWMYFIGVASTKIAGDLLELSERAGLQALFAVLFFLPPLLYFPLCEILFNGQTLGKRLMRIRVARVDGEPLTIGNSLLRFLLLSVDTLTGMVSAVLLIAFSPRSQRLGDMAAGTTVIDDRAYRRSRLNLNDYADRLVGYKPRYARAAELTQKQADIIGRALEAGGASRGYRLERLCAKVEPLCGKNEEADGDAELYLAQVLRDYRYYAALSSEVAVR